MKKFLVFLPLVLVLVVTLLACSNNTENPPVTKPVTPTMGPKTSAPETTAPDQTGEAETTAVETIRFGTKKLTESDLFELAKKGKNLSMIDFIRYEPLPNKNGDMYLFPVEGYKIAVGVTEKHQTYIPVISTVDGHYVDLMTGDLRAFLDGMK